MKIITNIIGAIAMALFATESAQAFNSADVSCMQTQYNIALSACKSSCTAACLSTNTTACGGYALAAEAIGICNCISSGLSADNCTSLQSVRCVSDTTPSASIGTTNLWYTRTWNTSSSTCTTSTSYYCQAGYYGTATGVNAGCSACPNNATCPGDKEQANVYCNKGYYAITTSSPGPGCTACTVADAYLDSDLTQPATPTTAGLTLLTQATRAATCYLPAGTYYDETGKFTITEDASCMY